MKLIILIIFTCVLALLECRKRSHTRKHHHHHKRKQIDSDEMFFMDMSKQIRNHQNEIEENRGFIKAESRNINPSNNDGVRGENIETSKDVKKPCPNGGDERFGCGKGYFEKSENKKPCPNGGDVKFGCGKGYFEKKSNPGSKSSDSSGNNHPGLLGVGEEAATSEIFEHIKTSSNDIKSRALKLLLKVESNLPSNILDNEEPLAISFKKKIVAGIGYYVKVKIGNYFFHVRLFHNLQRVLSVEKVIGPVLENNPIKYF